MSNNFNSSSSEILTPDARAVLDDLNSLVVNCAELREVERLLGDFNLFRVLRFEHGEIRHSNVLAWLFQPNESHGLKDFFLRRWLMRVFHESESDAASYIDPVELDSLNIRSVEVRREWNHIDLLLRILTFNGEEIVVAIENKVKAFQGQGQLSRYRQRIESTYKTTNYRLYIFLTRRDEDPEDDVWTSATYQQVHDILEECLNEQRSVIGNEPRVLLDHYLRLLKESFMENTEIANLARKIYQKHNLALDKILEFRPDSLLLLTEAVAQRVKNDGTAQKLEPLLTSKGYVRFIPQIWNTELNRQGTAWGIEKSAYIILEIRLWGRVPVLKIITGHAPEKWTDDLWAMSSKEPFKGVKRKKKPTKYMAVYVAKGKHPLEDLEAESVDDLADEIWKWCKAELSNENFKKCIGIIETHIKNLPQL